MAINLADFLPGDVKDPLSVAKLTETLLLLPRVEQLVINVSEIFFFGRWSFWVTLQLQWLLLRSLTVSIVNTNTQRVHRMCSLIYQSWICISGWKLSSSSSHNPSAFRSTSCSIENQLGGKNTMTRLITWHTPKLLTKVIYLVEV